MAVTVTNQKTTFDANSNSDYIVEAEDQGASGKRQVVKVAESALPSGAATDAKLDTIIANQLPDSHNVTIDNASIAITAASLPLPTDAATATNQTTLIGHVDGIETLLGTIDADTSALAAVDYATQTTLSALNAKVTACNTGAVVVSSSALPSGHSTIGNGSKNVTTAGAAEALAGSTSCKKVDIIAKEANTGTVWVGGSGVAADSGRPLKALQMYTAEISNLNLIYLDVSVSGEGVTYVYYN